MRRYATLAAFADRMLPSLLMALSVTLLSAGLLSYAPPAFDQWQTPEPSIGGGDPLFGSAPESALPSRGPIATPSGTATGPTVSPPASSRPSPVPATPTPGRDIATRIRIPALEIDLPIVPGDLIVRGNRDLYPLCDVAMFLPEFAQPGRAGTTYVYAHAQRGMFLPLLRASLKDDGAALIGALIEVYTSDSQIYLYEITRFKRHATDLSLTQIGPGEQLLVLQTSEGPSGTVPKLQVAAQPVAVVPSTASQSLPEAHPRVCLPD